MPPDPLPLLHFTDLALERCIRAEAQRRGFTRPEQFVTLDCSGSAELIRELDGIDRLTNLQHLDISGAELDSSSELLSLEDLRNLRSIRAADAALQDITPLLRIPLLTSATLTGNPNILCDRLRELAGKSIAVSADNCAQRMMVEFGLVVFDMELNRARTRAFISFPSARGIYEVDLATFAIVRAIQMPAPPRGLSLSADGGTLYAALDNIGSVGFVNLANGQIEVVDVTNELGNLHPYDVIEAVPGSVLVSADGPGLAYVALVRRDLANSVSRVASGRRVEGKPSFAALDDRSLVYVAGPLYRLDASQPSMPVVAEWPFVAPTEGGSLGSPQPQRRDLEISSDGSRLYATGWELDPQTLEKRRRIPGAWTALSADGTRLYAAEWYPFDAAGVYDTETLTRIGEQNWGCTFPSTYSGPTQSEPTHDPPDGIEITAYGLIAFRLMTLCGTRTVPYP
jgi:hypothetical protein